VGADTQLHAVEGRRKAPGVEFAQSSTLATSGAMDEQLKISRRRKKNEEGAQPAPRRCCQTTRNDWASPGAWDKSTRKHHSLKKTFPFRNKQSKTRTVLT